MYTGNFTPPTARLSDSQSSGTNIAAVTTSQTKLLIHSNLDTGGVGAATFADSATTGTTHGIVVTGCFHSTLHGSHVEGTGSSSLVTPAMAWPTSGKKYGSVGAYFDGTGDFMLVADDPDVWTIAATQAWTLDWWMYNTRLATDCTFFFGTSIKRLAVKVVSSRLQFGYGNGSAWIYGPADVDDASGDLVINTWQHIALVYDGSGSLKVFIGGVLKNTISTSVGFDSGGMYIGTDSNGSGGYQGYIDSIRFSHTARWATAFNTALPTSLYGASISKTIPTITLTGEATHGLAGDEDIEFTSVVNPTLPATTQHLTDTGIGLTLTNLSGGDKHKATLTGTVGLGDGTTRNGMAIKAQVRKSLGDAAYNNSTLVTFSGSTTTVGLAPGMPVTGTGISIAGPLTCGLTNADATVTAASTTGLVVGMQVNAFTGVPAGATIVSIDPNTSFELSANATAIDADAILTFNTIISAVASATTLTLSNATTGGSLSSQTLIFEDLTRVSHINGPDVLDGTQAMMTIVTAESGGSILFNARRYMGNGIGLRQITGFGFQPDLVWFKNRPMTNQHEAFDSIRGGTERLYINLNNAADTGVVNGVTAFLADGVQMGKVGTGHTNVGNGMNQDTKPIICWGWKAGEGTTTSGATTGSGTLKTFTRSVNTAGGFSIIGYTGNGSSGHTIPHGLTAAPDFVVAKKRESVDDWIVFHSSLGNATTTWRGLLNVDSAFVADSGTYWNNVIPDATKVTLGSASHVNVVNEGLIMYCWHAVDGVSAFGTYTGTGGAKTITYTGSNSFTARFIIIKRVDAAGSWVLLDRFRNATGELNTGLYADLDSAEQTVTAWGTTPTSTGFTFDSGTTNSYINDGSGTYIYAAFA